LQLTATTAEKALHRCDESGQHSQLHGLPSAASDRRMWFVAALALAVVFSIANFNLIIGKQAPIWDAEVYFGPAFTIIADHARAGRLVLWNPWEAGGTPEYAEPELGTTSPLQIAIGVITGGTFSGFRFYYLLIWLLGPVGILLLARHLDVRPWAGFVVALAFEFCGFYTAHAQHTSSLYSFSWLPFVIWRLDVALLSRRLWPAVQAGGLWGLSALGGYPQLTILTGGLMFFWALGRWASARWGEPEMVPAPASPAQATRPGLAFVLVALVLIVMVGVAIFSPSYLAFFSEGHGYSDRVGPRSRQEAISSNAMPAGALSTFASPYLTSLKLGNRELWLWNDVCMTNIYLGVLIPVLALLALLLHPRSVWRWWMAGIAVFCLLCAMGSQLPVRGWVYDFVLPTRYFRNAALFRQYAMFCAAVLALLALLDLGRELKQNSAATWRRLTVAALIVSATAVASYITVIRSIHNPGPHIVLANYSAALLWSGVVALSILWLVKPNTRAALPLFLIILGVCDAFAAARLARPTISSRGHAQQVAQHSDASHKPALSLAGRGLKRNLTPPAWIGGHPNNNNVPMKIPTFVNYSTMRNRFQTDFRKHPVLVKMSTTDRVWFASEGATVVPTDTFYQAFVKRSEEVGAPVVLLHSPAEMPKIHEPNLATPNDSEVVNSILRLPPAQFVTSNVLRYSPNHLDLKVSCPRDGWLLVTDRWSKGWRAKVNGEPTELFGGDFIFRAVRVKTGDNIIQFSYRPFGFPLLLILSWGTLAAVFVGPWLFRWKRSFRRLGTNDRQC
jgi:hypothetical protein